MSQSATLYRVKKDEFENIAANRHGAGVLDINAVCETFDGTHEGLCFVLSKFGNRNLTDSIFYPQNFIGNEVDFNKIDENTFDTLSQRIYYLGQEQVYGLWNFLKTINPEDFKKQFNAAELNKEAIYPWIWNEQPDEDTAYNEQHIVDDFKKLCSLFESAALHNEYVLSYVG